MKASGQVSRLYIWVTSIIAAVMLALAVSFCMGAVAPQDAYATIYAAPESEQAADVDERASTTKSMNGASAEEADEAAEGETIEDDETPMSSGLGGGEPVAGGVGFGGIAIVGIAIVAVFFLVLMRKTNGSIKDMRTMFK